MDMKQPNVIRDDNMAKKHPQDVTSMHMIKKDGPKNKTKRSKPTDVNKNGKKGPKNS